MERAEEFSLTRNAGLVGISKFVNILGLLAGSMILTRLLSRSEYGNYEQVWLVYNSILPLVGVALSSSIYFHSPREDRRAVYSSAVAAATIVGVAAGIVLAFLAPVIAHWFGAEALTGYIRIFSLYAVFSAPSLMFESIFVNERKVGFLLWGNVVLALLFAASILAAALFYHSLTIVFASIAVIGGLKSSFLIYFLVRSRNLSSAKFLPLMKAQAIYALPILVSGIAGTISKQVDRYLVSFLFTPDKFAIYAIGAKELPMISVDEAVQDSCDFARRSSSARIHPGIPWRGVCEVCRRMPRLRRVFRRHRAGYKICQSHKLPEDAVRSELIRADKQT